MSTEKYAGLPVKGYVDQSQENIARVNNNKELEERVLRNIDALERLITRHGPAIEQPLYDRRMLALSRTAVQEAFMWMNRAIMQPKRVELPEDKTGLSVIDEDKPRKAFEDDKPDVTANLYNASILWLADKAGYCVIGDIYDDVSRRFKDGTYIRSSPLLAQGKRNFVDGEVLTTKSGSMYRVFNGLRDEYKDKPAATASGETVDKLPDNGSAV